MTEHVQIDIADGVMSVTLNRPEKKNALSNAMYASLTEALLRAESDAGIRVFLLKATGDSFTVGNDLADFAAIATGKIKREDIRATAFLHTLVHAQKPIVIAVQGLAVGIGTTMLLHGDLVFVTEDAKLSTPFVNLGLVPEAGSSLLLQARIGYVRAYRMFALGESIDGHAAVATGIANEVVPLQTLHASALAAARALASKPSGALKAMKGLMRDTATIAAVIAKEGEIFSARLKTPEAMEALQAFSERRAPDFSKFN